MSVIFLSLAMIQAAPEGPVFMQPAPPPVSGIARLDCKVALRGGDLVHATIALDYDKRQRGPWIAIRSSDEGKLASMPATPAFSRGESNWLEYKSGIKLPDGLWQSVRYSVSSTSEKTTKVEFFRQDYSPVTHGDAINTLFAVGICSIELGKKS